MMSQAEDAVSGAYEEVCSFLVSESLCETRLKTRKEARLVALTAWSLFVYNQNIGKKMIKTISAVLVSFFILTAAPLFGGESWHEKEFEVRQSPKVISDWLKDHPKEVARSTGSELISKEGDKVRVRQDTPKGMMEFTLQETVKDNGNVYDYKSKLIKVHEGLIEDQQTTVRLSPSRRGGTIVTIKLSASVRETKPIAIKTGLNKSARGFQEMVESKFN